MVHYIWSSMMQHLLGEKEAEDTLQLLKLQSFMCSQGPVKKGPLKKLQQVLE